MTEMVAVYKGVKFTERDCEEAAALRWEMMTGRINWADAKLWYYEMPGHELVMLLKELSARDKAQVFVLPGLKDHFIFDPPDPVNYFK